MKQLVTLFLLLPVLAASAQSGARNTLSITTGPNLFFQFSERSDSRYVPRVGFLAGVDYGRQFGKHWEALLLIRYNAWHSRSESGDLRYPSEYGPDGTWTPDPSLPHSISVPLTDEAVQYLAGLRYHGRPGEWHWYAGLECGVTDYLETGSENAPIRFTMGAGAGLEWQPSARHFGLFLQPGARYIPRIPNHVVDFKFLAVSLEAGARMHF